MKNEYIRKYRQMRREKVAEMRKKEEKRLKYQLLDDAGFYCIYEVGWYDVWDFITKYAYEGRSVNEACAPYTFYERENIRLVIIPHVRRVAWAMRPECTVAELKEALAYVK